VQLVRVRAVLCLAGNRLTGALREQQETGMNITKARATGVSLLALLSATNASAETLAEIEAAARKDGMLTTIALPHD
jgi:hypothetical protein